MRLMIVLMLFCIIVSCKKDKPFCNNEKIYSEWENFSEIEGYVHFNVNSMVVNTNNEIIFSAYVRRDYYSQDNWIFKIISNRIVTIDSSSFFTDYNFYLWKKDEAQKEIRKGSERMFVYDRNDNICCKWHVTDLKNKQHSSRSQTDFKGNIWIVSDNYYGAKNDGLLMFDGNSWTTFFEGTDFRAVCFDKLGNLYASTLPNLEEPGIVMKYDYIKWDTVLICSGNAKWIPCMHSDAENNLWCGVLSRWAVSPESGDGLYKYDGKNITHYHVNNSKLPSNSVIDIAIDNEDNKWIAMYSGGLAKLSHSGTWKIFNPENTPMTHNSIEHVLVDNEKNVWMTGQSIGLARLKE